MMKATTPPSPQIPKINDLPKYYLGMSIERDIQLFGG